MCFSGFVKVVVPTCVFQYLEFCDNILVLEDGEIREAGNHQALMKANERYAQLITNYQLEQSEVTLSPNPKSETHVVILTFTYCFTRRKTFSPFVHCFTGSETISDFLYKRSSFI